MPKVFGNHLVPGKYLKKVICNKCGKGVRVKDEDFLDVEKGWGYHSPWDMEIHRWQLCSSCYQKIINSFKIPPKKSGYYIANRPG